jgi:H+/gluconate symporter-like permease
MTKNQTDIPFDILQEQMRDYIIEILQRPPEAVAIALVFAVTELVHERANKKEELPETLVDLIEKAGKEALILTDEITLAKPSSSETIH